MRRILAALVVCAGTTLCASDILTEGVDNGRTGWVKDGPFRRYPGDEGKP